jgi:type IV pilus assembly protein PilB
VSVLDNTTQKSIEEAMIRDGLITADELAKVKDTALKNKTPFITELIKEKKISTEDVTKYTAHSNNIPYVNLLYAKISEDELDLLPKEIAERFMAVPLGEINKKLVVAMLDAGNVQAVDYLSNRIGRPLKVYAASEEGIKNVLQQYKVSISGDVVGDMDEDNKSTNQDNDKGEDKISGKDAKELASIVQDSPISKALNTILEYASSNRASDVHIEPSEKDLKIRCRIDGVLREIMALPKFIEPALVSRIKILSNLKIDEHRIPQDGEFTFKYMTRNIDLRISISPVIWGEQVVIRLLDKTGTSLKLEDMGYLGHTLEVVRNGLKSTSGMVLTSGPTGSGKSTSLYALLQEIKNDTINIVTMEDPVEYKMPGINQIQVNSEVGLTFSTGLRSILRQDPDVIMVGEIRDKETADLGVQAALTGHLVFSTLHTNSSAGILPRLLDMQIEPFLIASTIRTVIGQRLLRKLSDRREGYESSPADTALINEAIGNLLPKNEEEREKVSKTLGYPNLPLYNQKAYTLYRGIDSPESPGGYRGRVGIYEAFEITQKIQELILKRSTSAEIQTQAQKEGMITMRQDGYLKALSGFTTLEEVNRVAAEDAN